VTPVLQERVGVGSGETLRIVRRALRYMAPFRSDLVVKIGLLLFSLLPMLVLPWPIRIVIDHVIGQTPIDAPIRPFPFFIQPLVDALVGASRETILFAALGVEMLLLFAIGAFGTEGRERDTAEGYLSSGQDTATRTENEASAGFSLIGGLIGWFDFRWTMRLTQKLNHHYRTVLFQKLSRLPLRTFDDERIGDAVFRVMYDTPAITNVSYRVLLTPIGAPTAIALTVSVLALVYGLGSPVVLLAMGFLPMVLLTTLPYAGVVRRNAARSRRAGATTTTTVEEGMHNILAVQSLGGESRERKRFDQDSAASFAQYRSVVGIGLVAILTAGALGVVLVGRVFTYVGDEIIAGRLSVGDLGVMIPSFVMIATASVDLGALWIRVQESSTGLARVFFLMDLPDETDPPGAKPLAPVTGSVRVEDVHFAYESGGPGLRGVSFEATRGRLTAFVGPAGAGKTTLAYMIPRFLSPDRGRVVIDGTDVSGVTLDSLRSQISFVFQETALFDATVAENLRLGNPRASDDRLRECARIAGAHDFVEALPQGYDTRLGRGGGKLSVGQKQRLAIARALVRDAAVLIFDEPTSALDAETERRVAEALQRIAQERIVIVIAHRLSTIRGAGQILFLEDGRIIDRGSHAELMARPDGPYRRFVELQAQGSAQG
jgi:ABC-type multidrug transport system fused ATPase/permease subunit